jgi:hypothetical protein
MEHGDREEDAAADRGREQPLDLARRIERGAEHQPEHRRGRRQAVGDDAVVEVDQRDRHEERDEHEPEHELGDVAVVHGGDGEPQERRDELDRRVAAADRDAAVAAPTAQEQPGDDRHVVVRAHRRAAARARRARRDEREAGRQAIRDDVEERADDEPEEGGGEKCERHAGLWRVGGWDLRPWRSDAAAEG